MADVLVFRSAARRVLSQQCARLGELHGRLGQGLRRNVPYLLDDACARQPSPDLRSRFCGCLLGLAVGTPLEFAAPGTFEPISDMVGGGAFELEPGQRTDDMSMALCLASSLVECEGFDAKDPEHAIRGKGYVVQSLEAALWAFDSTTSFPDAILGGGEPWQRRGHHCGGLRSSCGRVLRRARHLCATAAAHCAT